MQIQLNRMERQKEKLMSFIYSLPEDICRRQPDITTWSILQVANHLYLSENFSLAYIRKKLSYPDTIVPFNIKSWWSTVFVMASLWLPIRTKAPKNIDMRNDQPVLSPDELDKKWEQVRQELVATLEESSSKFKTHLVFRHPFAGRMTLTQMLMFFNHHIAHHRRQILKIKKRIT
jgi:uncharacterized damage-inducible protein DinB